MIALKAWHVIDHTGEGKKHYLIEAATSREAYQIAVRHLRPSGLPSITVEDSLTIILQTSRQPEKDQATLTPTEILAELK